MLRTVVFFSLITSAHATLDNLVDAAQSFATAIDQQITTDQSESRADRICRKNDGLRGRENLLLQSVEGGDA